MGGSGFIGHALYKELSPYFNTYGTYYSDKKFKTNQQFFHFDHTQDDIHSLLKKINPKIKANSMIIAKIFSFKPLVTNSSKKPNHEKLRIEKI